MSTKRFIDNFLSDYELQLIFGILKDLSIDYLTSKEALKDYLLINGISEQTINNIF